MTASPCPTGPRRGALPVASRPRRRPRRPAARPRPHGPAGRRRVDGQGRGRGRTRRRPQRALQVRRPRHRRRGPQAHLQRGDAVHAQRDLAGGQGRGAGRERVRLPRPRQRLAEHLPAVPDRDQGRPRSRPAVGRRRRQARLLRRGLHPEQHPPGAQRGRAPVPPVLRVREHRARAVAGDVRRSPRAGRQLRRRVHRRGRARGDRGGPPRPSGDQRDPPAVHDQPDARPGLPQRADLARAPPGAVRVAAHARSPIPDGRGHLVAVGLLPLDRRRPRAPGVRRDGRDAVADRREPGGLRRPRRRRGRRGGRRRAVRLAGEGPGPVGDRRHHHRRRDPAAPDRRGGARDRRHAGLRGHRARDLDQRLRARHRPRPARLGAHA